MITNEKNPTPIHEATPEEESLLERSSAPTLRDLRAAAKDLLTTIEAEAELTSPNDRLTEKQNWLLRPPAADRRRR